MGSTATTPSTHHLRVPGGSLYYEVRGSGPLLLVIGQPMTAAPFAAVADELAADHTVVTYDPHGLGASTVDDPALPVTPEIQADDLAALVDAVGGGPADVVASSGGAVAALAFAARHPDKARTVIAHEPPLLELLPDAANARAAVDGVEDTYRAGGAGAAWGAFVSLVMHEGPIGDEGVKPAAWPPAGAPETEQDTEPQPASDAGIDDPAKQAADDELFFLRMLKPFTRFIPDTEQLRSGTPTVVVAVGAASGPEAARRAAEALAAALGQAPAEFPGDHGGFMSDPAAFAAAARAHL